MVRSLSALNPKLQAQQNPILTPPSTFKVNETAFPDLYELGKELGSGQFAVVYKVTSRKTGEKFAAKFIKKRRYATSRRGVPRNHIEREVEVLRAVGGHENVIQLYDVFETPTDIILVLELVSGGELFDHVCANEHLDEAEASAFVKQILLGIRHLHSRYVVHLDIKPENIMLKEAGKPRVKLIDFGLSRHIYPGVPVKDMIGTPEFVAPEVVNYEPLSPATDMWALGVVTYILLSGGSPFLGRTRDETFCNITSVNYHFSPTYFGNTSQLAKDFIGRLFVKEVNSRATVEDCLNHPWIKGPDMGITDIRIGSTISVSKIQGFKVKMRWRRAMEIIRICWTITRRAREEWKAATSRGYSIDSRYDKDDLITSAILVACEEGNLPALEQLSNVHRLSLLVSNEHGETPLHIASGSGFEQVVSFLEAKGGFLDAPDRRGDTPLFWAARNGHANVIHQIGDRVVVDTKNKNSETALHVATRYAQVTSVLSLLEKGASIDVSDEHGETPLHIASWHGYTLLLSILCRFGPTLDLKNGATESIPVPSSARSAASLRIFSGRDSNSSRASTVSESDELKLEEAVERLEKVAESLSSRIEENSESNSSENVISPKTQENSGTNPFNQPLSDVESCSNCSEVEETEVDSFPDVIFHPSEHSNTSTVRASERSSSSTVSSGVVLMASENEESDYDQTKNPFSPYFKPTKKVHQINPFENSNLVTDSFPNIPKLDFQLHDQYSISSRPSEALISISKAPNPFRLEAWADPREAQTARIERDSTFANFSQYEEKEDCTSEEFWKPKEGSHSEPTTQRKPAPCAVNYPEIEDSLNPKSGDFLNLVSNDFSGFMEFNGQGPKFYPDGCFTDDETALHCAAARGHIECVQCLVESGANVDSQDQNGQTALHLALRRSHIDIALYLISKECDMNIKDVNEDTPLHVACRLGLNSVVQMLCHLGADVNMVNTHGETPIQIAAKEGHVEIVRCLCFVGTNVNAKNKEGMTAETLAISKDHQQIAQLLNKVKNESQRLAFVDQLCPSEGALRRIKLKIFGNSQSGKSKLVQGLQGHGVIGNFINAVSRRFSDNSSGPSKMNSDEGIHSCASSSASTDSDRNCSLNYQRPTHSSYTRGIDVQNVAIGNGDEFSVWEFGGYDPYHIAYDHFVGNTDCVHIITLRADEPTEIQYRQALYWMNFLKGRVTPSEPIGHRGIIARRSKVVIVASNATASLLTANNGFEKQSDGNYSNSDAEAMMKTIRLRFESHFDVHEKLIFVDSANSGCQGMKIFKSYLQETREELLTRLQRPLVLLDACMTYLSSLRKRYHNFPVITWLHFTNLIRDEVNPLASDSHCQQLIHQLQLIGEVVYLRDETAEIDYVVITPEWLGTHILGTILSADFLGQCRESGCYSADDFASTFPEIAEPNDLINILDTLHLCSPLDPQDSDPSAVYEFPAFLLSEPPRDIWMKDKSNYVYGGMRILPMRGMESTLQSTFPRLQVAMRNQLHDYRDPSEVSLQQWQGFSKLVSNKMEAIVRLNGDAVEIQVRGPQKMAPSCIYFLEDIANVIEQTTTEIAPGMSLERHFLSPKHLREHISNPASFAPEVIMAMQQRESLSIVNSDGEEELFTDVVCFGSREVAAMLTLGIDMSVSQLTMPSRCELAALLDPPDAMGRDWSILAVKLNLAETLPEVDSTGQSISQTDQLISEWSIKCPESATVGKFCAILEEMGRSDARDALYRTVPLYMFAPLDEQPILNPVQVTSQRDTTTSIADSGVLLSSAPRSSSTLSN